ncbi:MAG: T9SS type A sorting domain-containing protein [Bacteroidota bacterium]
MKKSLIMLGLIIASKSFFAQDWVDMAAKPNANLYEIQKEFNKFFAEKDLTVKSTGYKAFKRWEYFVGPRVYPTGNLSVMNQASKNYADFLLENKAEGKLNSNSAAMSTTWTAAGPIGAPTGSVGGQPRKAGRDNFITFHPTNPLIMYAGSAGGGLWITTNGGTSWYTTTDNLTTGAISDLAIDPTNPNIMYLANGGGDDLLAGTSSPSDGVYKSIDGGNTWTQTSLTFLQSANRAIHRIVLDPTNSSIVFAATSVGLYKSTNSGATWALASGVHFWDIKFHPTNPTIMYGAGTSFYRSTNSGATFTQISSGITTTQSNRMCIAVTPTNPTNVYVVASRSSDSQFLAVYRSTDNGITFTTASTTPNILGNACAGNSTGAGQGWYDLAIAASPTNPNEIVVGGVNVWKSTDNGSTWTIIGCWVGTGSPPYIHADIHELEYTKTGTLYSSNDGGIFSYNGSSWPDLTANRNIAQMYKIGLSAITPNRWITGHQDNGTNIRTGVSTNYIASLAGDGMDCFIDRTADNTMFGEQYNGSLNRSFNGGASWTGCAPPAQSGTGAWVTPWKQDPQTASTIYAGYAQLWKSTNQGTSWTQAGTSGGGGTIVEFAIAPSNNQIIYVLYTGAIRKTTNGGATWTNATNGITGGALTFITVDPTDPNTAWATVSGYTAGSKVWQTVDGGATWMNISSNLPNLPANCSVYETGSNDRIYIGMDIGIYYKDNSSTNWTLYNTGLPNTVVMDMEMSPASPGKIYAATYGRGVYEADVVPVTAAPVANFSSYSNYCVGVTQTMNDNSTNTPTTWSWTVTPATGVTINSASVQNPTLTFSNPGIYTVSLISGNSFGSSPISTKTVGVYSIPTLSLSANTVTICEVDPVIVTASGANTYTWSDGGGNNATVTYTVNGDQTFTVTGSNFGCIATATLQVYNILCTGVLELGANNTSFNVYPTPAIDNITLKMNGSKNIDVTFEVYDVSGKLVIKQNGSFSKDKLEQKINVAALANGIYFLKVVSKQGSSQNLKIVKE